MKFLENHFDKYLQASDLVNLHPHVAIVAESNDVRSLPHYLFYGPPGVGKYTQALRLLRHYSPSALKYEKKLQLVHDKRTYLFRISDVHVEVDMALLGCNARSLWHELYLQLQDVISAKQDKTMIVLCKHFHEVHHELLDTFYSYFAGSSHTIKYMLLTDQLSFLPECLLRACQLVRFPRPDTALYEAVLRSKERGGSGGTTVKTSLTNIKLATLGVPAILERHRVLCDKLLHAMLHIEQLDVLRFRDSLHDVFIYQLPVADCTYYLLSQLLQQDKLPSLETQTRAVFLTLRFLRMINANFRPLFHLEYYLLQLALLAKQN